MAQELAEYKAESTELKNQEGTIRRLEERVRNLEAQLQERVSFPGSFPQLHFCLRLLSFWHALHPGNGVADYTLRLTYIIALKFQTG